MSEFNYLRTKRRYLKSIGAKNGNCYNVKCEDCSLSAGNNKAGLNCQFFEFQFPDEATKMMKEWEKEHPITTNLEKFIEVFGDEEWKNVRVIAGWWDAEYKGGEDNEC